MATLYIDNQPYEVNDQDNLLHACLSLGFDIPYFCYHPALGSVGACRQCAIKLFKDENDDQGKIVMSCMQPVQDGMRISIDDQEVFDFRARVIEWLMINHPHDCPVCDEGGHCHLQDMTVMTGHNYRRYRFKKRTYRNQNLGPFIHHEMNRCIQCYRCVRFYREYSGGTDLDVFAAHDHVYFGRHKEGTLESPFSGNLIEVCPTGVFTDKMLKKHYVRKWDLQMSPSVCPHCSLGCNIIAGERYGTVRTILNRYHGEVNGYFLCDRGRFGHGFVHHEKRLHHAWHRRDNRLEPIESDSLIKLLSEQLTDSDSIIGIGSPRASMESNYALRKLVGEENFYAGISDANLKLSDLIVDILAKSPAVTPSLKQIQRCDAVLILGQDVQNTAPLMALAVRQSTRQQPMQIADKLKIHHWHDHAVREAVQDEKGPLFIAVPHSTPLDDLATDIHNAAPQEIARLGFAIAHEIDPNAAKVQDLDSATRELAKTIATTLQQARNPLIISGTSLLNESIILAASDIATSLCKMDKKACLSYVLPENNSMGLAMMRPRPLSAALEKANKPFGCAIILENDLYQHLNPNRLSQFLECCNTLVVLDILKTETSDQADMVLPAASFAEGNGTFVNNEGRAQRYYQVLNPNTNMRDSWDWLGMLWSATHPASNSGWDTLDDLIAEIEQSLPVFKGLGKAAPDKEFRIVDQKIPRQTHRYSGRTAMNAHHQIHEPKPPEDKNSALAFSMEGYSGKPPSSLIPYFWAPQWNSVQAVNKYQNEVGGALSDGDSGIRLLEPPPDPNWEYYNQFPKSFQIKSKRLLLVPRYRIFGSEWLSRHSGPITERIAPPTLIVNEGDVRDLQKTRYLEFVYREKTFRVNIEIDPRCPRGVAALSAGYPEHPVPEPEMWINPSPS